MKECLLIILSYLYGSIPFALVIGKVFYKTDVRQHGSGNLGGSNVGRVLGKPAGIACIVLDASKAFLVMFVCKYFVIHYNLIPDFYYLCAFACVIGHCFPIFAGFKGGKAVSTAIGYFFAINPLGAVLSLVIFFIVLKLSKYVSLSSCIASGTVLIFSPLLNLSMLGTIATWGIVLLLIYRHKSNFINIKNKTERKITWM
ncbi:glycerol-3-phosphate 1-O-acyltransferase PlsY [Tannockella kyphosi]|uniref:glycerol-3-phosphate 1-O-acyltransferase PlsY n=1 Tax=Tannockella kyphosi TaxID=2899121 RepID=UPI0020110534|nr:glycerol-3-phosphate 1-O-acyltransferase PlsY [Tannockella kyphosi]